MSDATSHRVWIVYEDDLSHGIQQILGVYSTKERAEHVVDSRHAGQDVEVEEWTVDD